MTTKKSKKNEAAKPGMTDGQVEEAARLFGVLAEPARLYLLRTLMEGGETVGRLVEKTGLKQGTVSKHLGILHGAGFLERRRDGANVYYEISDPLVQQLCGLMCERMREEAARQYARLAG
jgi:DNA-binding transcriptional ArsR family regulator